MTYEQQREQWWSQAMNAIGDAAQKQAVLANVDPHSADYYALQNDDNLEARLRDEAIKIAGSPHEHKGTVKRVTVGDYDVDLQKSGNTWRMAKYDLSAGAADRKAIEMAGDGTGLDGQKKRVQVGDRNYILTNDSGIWKLTKD